MTIKPITRESEMETVAAAALAVAFLFFIGIRRAGERLDRHEEAGRW